MLVQFHSVNVVNVGKSVDICVKYIYKVGRATKENDISMGKVGVEYNLAVNTSRWAWGGAIVLSLDGVLYYAYYFKNLLESK